MDFDVLFFSQKQTGHQGPRNEVRLIVLSTLKLLGCKCVLVPMLNPLLYIWKERK